MIESFPVQCSKCKTEFNIIKFSNKILGRFYCPECGLAYEYEGIENE